jgi:5'-nucleotidase
MALRGRAGTLLTSTRPRAVLVTTDDGPGAPGLEPLVAAVRDLGERLVVATPQTSWSGCGTAVSLTPARTAPVRQLERGDEILEFEVEGPPAAAVFAAHRGELGPRPALTVVGVNSGPNVGPRAIHSGTVGAALTASHFGIPSVAVSLDDMYSVDELDPGPRQWGAAAAIGRELAAWLLRRPVPASLSVNVPNLPPSLMRGLRSAELGLLDHERPPRRLFRAPGRGRRPLDHVLLREGFAAVVSLTRIDGTASVDAGSAARWATRRLAKQGFFAA